MKTLLIRATAVLPVLVVLLGFSVAAMVDSPEVNASPAYVLVAEEDDSSDEDEECEDDECDEEEEDEEPSYVPPPTPSPTPTTASPTPTPTPSTTTAAPSVDADTRPTSSQTTRGGVDPSAVIVFGFFAVVAVAAVVDAIRRRGAPALAEHRAVEPSAFEPSSGELED